MSFARGGSDNPDDMPYTDPIAGGVLGEWVGLGAAVDVASAAKGAGGAVGAGASTGALIGSVVPVLGTTVGAIVGGIVGGLSKIFGGHETTGLPQKPVNDREYAHALAMKWFNLYLDDWTSTDDYGYWTNEIMKDGPERAWKNFIASQEPIQKQAAQKAAQYASQYGGPYVVNAGDTIPGSSQGVTTYTPPGTTSPYHPPTAPPGTQASVIPGVSNTMLLVAALGIGGALLLSKRRGRG